ncbi:MULTISPECIES: 4-demethylwyosine synthase TYW1 [Methanobrevibacter]|jgi:Fe-S oxidoreductases|uniref:S-adenosyl-L-methionine-dependent tRNA 4-demethylwyosine synthase n=1 Tax=Methanobrevibacter smithii (strain ATCC 35061 / DSM 861 / OCM 144 / PS) TaxID=420247 RepID=A5ULP9_METS3|nr:MULTISPECIES: 4-demethylwyosine synthase TYW1 [Methanobrevibacter]ABQ87127.1 Fe-S oxidoreductase [Methanobrevibacter smithii ATCC 35061]OED05199.1 tRNA-modifying enzyme [Methanobrevibacter sp. A54]
MSLNKKQVEKLESSGYRFVGSHNHAAAKICHWTKQSILDKGVCYKEKFYGIESHRCLQMAPAVPNCQQKCEFCWRDLSYTQTQWEGEYDDPKTIIDEAVKAQNNLLCGFFGNDKANKEKLEESKTPTNAAISLAGEPMLYPEIDELIAEFNRRNFTTFVVSNGQCVDKLKNLENEPYQLYLSLDAPTKKIYNDVCRPQISEGWDNLNQSLDTLASFNSRTCIRTTCVKGRNMTNPEKYAELIKKASPDFVEIKAYMCVGSSRHRLTPDNMPTFDEVKSFAQKIGENCGKKIVNESEVSRVVLLQ